MNVIFERVKNCVVLLLCFNYIDMNLSSANNHEKAGNFINKIGGYRKYATQVPIVVSYGIYESENTRAHSYKKYVVGKNGFKEAMIVAFHHFIMNFCYTCK